MNLNRLFNFLGLLAFQCNDDNNQKIDITNAGSDDAMNRRRKQASDLTHALGVLGVKASTFHSMLKRGEQAQVRKMLKAHLKVHNICKKNQDSNDIDD